MELRYVSVHVGVAVRVAFRGGVMVVVALLKFDSLSVTYPESEVL